MTYPWFFPEGMPSLFHDGPAANDTRLACRVVEQMSRDPLLRHERICVEAQNRVVILEGRVGSADAAARARALAWAVPGVHDVNVRVYVV
ncbi:BON domain-containing protein [Micromonospora sp. WMMA1998]|uniref:BON domain-containing protein n=1 Tax=Micromonospora sp. WMMA1998 TaxID=3015167 RepID=UPI00248AD23B|nr:BON domain-containing protein [Micromonospora sp. WMMA1998]WBC16681.1 BON domain-containing protein [Micromonospora sp. WMMA1998]